MEIVKLPVERREKTGSAESRRLRRDGRLPVVLYGMDRAPTTLTVDAHRFETEFRRGRRMFDLSLGEKTQVSLLKDVAFDALGERVLHVDFVRIDDQKPVTVSVALEFIAVPAVVAGAVIDYITRDINVSCLPRQIPDSIPVRLNHLAVGDHLEAGQIGLPEGVTLADPPARTIASYHFKHVETAPVAEAEAGPAEPEVLTERKPVEGEGEKGTEKEGKKK